MQLKSSILAALAMSVAVFANEPEDNLPALPAKITTTFPKSDSTLGLRLVNGQSTLARVQLSNLSPEPLNLAFIGARLVKSDDPEEIIRNYTLTKTDALVKAGGEGVVDYEFEADLMPQEGRLNIFAAVTDQTGMVFQVVAFNGTASVVDPALSFFDPQILFLYGVLGACFYGLGSFIYHTWIQALLPAPAPKPRAPKKVPVVVEPTSGDESGVTSAIDESWIPDIHKTKPRAPRGKGKGKKSE